jgi:hypothetical protein
MTQLEKCLICLDDAGDISKKHSHLACRCNVSVHTHCWMQYVKTKNGTLECPLCHVITLINPILPASITGMPKDVYVPSEQVDEHTQRDRCVGKYICFCILSWASTITVGALFA